MLYDEYMLTKLFSLVPQIKGRKRLQKIIYLLQQSRISYTERFTYRCYGPYSSELQSNIDRLIDYGWITGTNINKNCVYRITKEGFLFIKEYETIFENTFKLPENIVIQLLNTDILFLEIASTYAYLIEFGCQENEAIAKTLKLKSCSEDTINEIQKFLINLKQKVVK